MTEESRELGPEMVADGWIVIGGDHILWMHPPSRRAVALQSIGWACCERIPFYGAERPSPDAKGYLVGCSFDELGNPTTGHSLFVESYGLALRLARRTRADILAERPVRIGEQLTLDDAIDAQRSA